MGWATQFVEKGEFTAVPQFKLISGMKAKEKEIKSRIENNNFHLPVITLVRSWCSETWTNSWTNEAGFHPSEKGSTDHLQTLFLVQDS